METDVTLYWGLGGAPVVAALVQVVKQTLAIDDAKWTRWIPLCSVALGILWNALIASITMSGTQWQMVLFLGIFTGLSASGLYSGAKNALKSP